MKSTEIAGENWVNANCVFALTNGGPAANLYDQDPGSVCSSSGSAEGTQWQATVTFQDRNGLPLTSTLLIKPWLYSNPPQMMTWTLYADFTMKDCYELAWDPGSVKENLSKKTQLYTITGTVKER